MVFSCVLLTLYSSGVHISGAVPLWLSLFRECSHFQIFLGFSSANMSLMLTTYICGYMWTYVCVGEALVCTRYDCLKLVDAAFVFVSCLYFYLFVLYFLQFVIVFLCAGWSCLYFLIWVCATDRTTDRTKEGCTVKTCTPTTPGFDPRKQWHPSDEKAKNTRR